MGNYTNLKNIIDQYITTNGQGDITGAILNDVLKSIVNSIGADFLFGGIVEPSYNVGSPDQNVFYIAIKGGTYTNFGNVVIPDGITIFKWNGSWSYQILFAGDGGVFDITSFHNNTEYADLTAALGTNGANIPENFRKGGMSVKFVRSSNHKYELYTLVNQSFSTNASDWILLKQTIDISSCFNPINIRNDVQYKETNKAISNNQNIINATSLWGYTDYIEVNPDILNSIDFVELQHVHDHHSQSISFGFAYDENKQLIKIFADDTTAEDMDLAIKLSKNEIPSNTRYFRFNGNPSAGLINISYLTATAVLVAPYAKKELVNSVSLQLQSVDDCCYKSKAWYYNNGNPILMSAVSSWKASTYIRLPEDAISNGFSITNVRCYTAQPFHIGYFFDENLKYLGFIGTGTEGNVAISLIEILSSNIPTGAKYIVFNGNAEKGSLCSFSTLKASLPQVDVIDQLIELPVNPLEKITREVGFTSMFINWGFIGDSLCSGEYNCKLNGVDTHYDAYDFSWGQFICRLTGAQGYNFSQGGQTAHGWINGSGDRAWGGAQNNPKTAYIIAFGHNDINIISSTYPIGTVNDVDLSDYTNNANSFCGDYAGIIQRLRSIQPNVPIFCCTTFNGWGTAGQYTAVNNAIRQCVSLFSHVYLLDMYQYFPNISGEWASRYRNSSHFTAQGYLEVAWGIMNYIDYIVRHNWGAFKNQGLIGTNYTL